MKSPCDELRRARPLLGTIVEITARSSRKPDAERAIDRAFAAISVVQRRMSFHDRNSTLSRVNAEASARPISVDEKTFQVLEMARDLYALSNGVFDPTIAPYLERTGFLPRCFGKTAGNGTSFTDVELLQGNRVQFRHAGIRLDLGGIAKGFAVDEAITALRTAGLESGLVNAGGDLRAFGRHLFPVEIRHPSRPGNTLAALTISNQAVATSAHYFADRLRPGARTGPFVHPRFGQLQGDLLSVTVIASNAMLADALTKIVMVDPAQSPALLQRLSAAALIFDSKGSVLCTPNWHETLKAAA
jgi:thiamine biosynthesis lipoprotein